MTLNTIVLKQQHFDIFTNCSFYRQEVTVYSREKSYTNSLQTSFIKLGFAQLSKPQMLVELIIRTPSDLLDVFTKKHFGPNSGLSSRTEFQFRFIDIPLQIKQWFTLYVLHYHANKKETRKSDKIYSQNRQECLSTL